MGILVISNLGSEVCLTLHFVIAYLIYFRGIGHLVASLGLILVGILFFRHPICRKKTFADDGIVFYKKISYA